MSAMVTPTCTAEIHFPDEGIGRQCSLAEGHEGPHWGMRPVANNGYSPISWWGTDGD